MFKKVKHSNGKREIYFGKKKIFQYLRQSQFADFVESKINNNLVDSLSHTLALETAKVAYDANKFNVNGGGGEAFTPLNSSLTALMSLTNTTKSFMIFTCEAKRVKN